MEVNRIFDLLPYYAETFRPKEDVLAGKEAGQWVKYDIGEYTRLAGLVSYGLLSLGIQPGDRVATILNNRPEWNFLDIGIMQAGAVHVPIYPTISEADYFYILNHAEVKILFISGDEILRKIQGVVAKVASILEVITVKPVEGMRSIKDLYALGQQNPVPEKLGQIMAGIRPGDMATMIYTSGTTGNPKGVMLSHRNILSNVTALSDIPWFGWEARILSFLPLSHIYERMLNYLYFFLGMSIYYAENMGTIADNIRDVRPQMMCAVPRLLEKVYEKFIDKGRKQKGIKKMIFFWAVNLAKKFELYDRNSAWYRLKLKIADKLVLAKWRNALGGNFQIIVSGGAAIQPTLSRIYWAAGMKIYEGYGLTETSPVIAVSNNNPGGIRFGTVGPPLRGVEVNIAGDGEILCKGPNIMLGYYKEPELTRQVIEPDGWFHTGDIGLIEPEGQVRITGRKKEIFKTSLGKYIAPQLIENLLSSSPFIDQVMVVGENQKFAAAIVVPDFEHLKSWCRIKEIPYTTNREMVTLPRIRKRFQKEIDKYNQQLGSTEQIKRSELVADEWSITTGELTPTLKVKRDVVTRRYQDLINKMFSLDPQA